MKDLRKEIYSSSMEQVREINEQVYILNKDGSMFWKGYRIGPDRI